jgi:outer membrane protein W
MTIRRLCLFALVLTLFTFTTALAEKGDSKIRFGIQWISPTGDASATDGSVTIDLEADAATGPFFEYEYMVGDKAGFFANLSTQNHDIDADASDPSTPVTLSATIGDVDVTPLELGLNFYVVQNDSVQLFLGPKIAYVFYGDVELDSQFVDPGDPSDVSTDDELGYGANLGLDVPFGEGGWGFFVGLQYLVLSLETDEGGDSVDLDIDPFVLRAGVGKRF